MQLRFDALQFTRTCAETPERIGGHCRKRAHVRPPQAFNSRARFNVVYESSCTIDAQAELSMIRCYG